MTDLLNSADHPRTHLRGIRGLAQRLQQDWIGRLGRAIEKLLVGPLPYLTDVLFPALRRAFPQHSFTRKENPSGMLRGRFDLVLVLVIREHVVDRHRLATALADVAGIIAESGPLFLALPFAKGSPKPLFHLRSWGLAEITSAHHAFQLSPPVPWRDGWLLVARRVAGARPRPAPDA